MNQRGWSHFPHQADVGLCGRGPSMEAAFEEAALALTAAVTTAEVSPNTKVEAECNARTPDLLLVAWLNAVIYEMSVRNMLFSKFKVHIYGNRLTASFWGEKVDRARHEPACEPKGATYTALSVVKAGDGSWTAQCVVDV